MHNPETPPAERAAIALMVYDATLYCLIPFVSHDVLDLFAGQIEAAREAHLWATGDESMCRAVCRTQRVDIPICSITIQGETDDADSR